MKCSLIVRPEAEQDLAEAYDWYENQATGLGVVFLGAVDSTFETITSNPHFYQKIHRNLRRALLRRFPYCVFYLESELTVTVIAVIHGRRDPTRWQERV